MGEIVVKSSLIRDEEIITIPLAMHEGEEVLTIRIRPKDKKRTSTQNASLHVYCDQMAQAMTEAGITQRDLVGRFKKGFELPVTGHMIKAIFREVGKAMFGKESTADLTTTEVSDIYRVVDERFGEVTGVTRAWPDNKWRGMR